MTAFNDNGYLVINDVYTTAEINEINTLLATISTSNPNFRKTADLFAIRQLLKEIPSLADLVFSPKMKQLIDSHLGTGYFVVRSIYFDKPPQSNWAVPWHQDITISVAEKIDTPGFSGWTNKHGQYSVCPPVQYMQNICTIRIHLDDTNAGNGALKIFPGSHQLGIVRPSHMNIDKEKAIIANVKQGGVMLMKPLLFHSSDRTSTNSNRRVIHIEMSNIDLPGNLQWSEKMLLPA